MQIIETSESNGPLTFEVGAGEIMGNKMFQVEALQTKHANVKCCCEALFDLQTQK